MVLDGCAETTDLNSRHLVITDLTTLHIKSWSSPEEHRQKKKKLILGLDSLK